MKKTTLKKSKTNQLYFLILLLSLFCVSIASAQNKTRLNYAKQAEKKSANYFRIVEKKKQELKSYDLKNINDLKEYKHFNRWKEYWRIRVNADGSFPGENLAYYNAGILNERGELNTRTYQNRGAASQETWTNIGTKDVPNTNGYPNYPQMGRLSAFLRIKNPVNKALDVLFVGAPNGGIWKSTDGGATWSPKLDMAAGIGVTDIKTTPDATFANYTTKPIYVSTGDYDGKHATSIGVLKSTDGGETYASTGLTFPLSDKKLTGELVVVDANTVFVGTSTGISKTSDGGANWTEIYRDQQSNVGFGRVAISGNQIMYTGNYHIVYTSDYNSGSWEVVGGDPDYDLKSAVTVGEDGSFYIQKENETPNTRNTIGGQIMKFNSSTKSFTKMGTKPAGYNGQGGYNQALIVRNDMIISGEFNGSHSTDGGENWYRSLNGYWSNPTNPQAGTTSDGTYIHSDHHKLGKLDGAYEFWSLNDGGLSYINYSSNTDQHPTVEYKSAKTIVTQHYSVAINPKVGNSDDYIVGNQDNDAFSKVNGVWYAVAQGDGIESAINYNNPNVRYATNQGGLLTKSDTGFKDQLNGAYATYNSTTGASTLEGVAFNHYMELNRVDPTIIYINANGDKNKQKGILKVTDTGSSLPFINMDNGFTANKFNTHGSLILSISDNNIIRKIPTDGATPTSITGAQNLGTGIEIESIDFNASNNNVIYVSTKGYNAGKKVFKSTNGGTSFTNITNDLPDVIINKILLKQGQSTEIIFAATNVGVYYTNNGGVKWSKLGQDLPNVDVKDIEINYAADKLVAATFGRGLWQINVANTTLGVDQAAIENSLKLSLYPNPLNSGNLKISFKEGINAVKYEIYNVVGGIVKKGAVNTANEINVDNLANNIYLIRLYNNDFSVTKKLVLAK